MFGTRNKNNSLQFVIGICSYNTVRFDIILFTGLIYDVLIVNILEQLIISWDESNVFWFPHLIKESYMYITYFTDNKRTWNMHAYISIF